MWFQAIRAFQSNQVEIPINLKFIIESMNRCGSVGLEDFLYTKRQDFLNDIDYVVVCDTEWLGEKQPCLTYGVVGMFNKLISTRKKNPFSKRNNPLRKLFNSL